LGTKGLTQESQFLTQSNPAETRGDDAIVSEKSYQ